MPTIDCPALNLRMARLGISVDVEPDTAGWMGSAGRFKVAVKCGDKLHETHFTQGAHWGHNPPTDSGVLESVIRDAAFIEGMEHPGHVMAEVDCGIDQAERYFNECKAARDFLIETVGADEFQGLVVIIDNYNI